MEFYMCPKCNSRFNIKLLYDLHECVKCGKCNMTFSNNLEILQHWHCKICNRSYTGQYAYYYYVMHEQNCNNINLIDLTPHPASTANNKITHNQQNISDLTGKIDLLTKKIEQLEKKLNEKDPKIKIDLNKDFLNN